MDGKPSLQVVLSRLRELMEAISAGQEDPAALQLAPLARMLKESLATPPTDVREQEDWLTSAGEALRLASELCALKAERLAPAPGQPAPPGPSEELADSQEEASSGSGVEEAVSADQALQERLDAYLKLQQAALALARQAESFARHQSRPEPSALMQALRLLGPWPEQGPGVSAERLAEVLGRVLRRQHLAQAARQAPAPSLDWEPLLARIRDRVGPGPVELGELFDGAQSRAEVIERFLAVLELVRVGELWLADQDGQILVRRRIPS